MTTFPSPPWRQPNGLGCISLTEWRRACGLLPSRRKAANKLGLVLPGFSRSWTSIPLNLSPAPALAARRAWERAREGVTTCVRANVKQAYVLPLLSFSLVFPQIQAQCHSDIKTFDLPHSRMVLISVLSRSRPVDSFQSFALSLLILHTNLRALYGTLLRHGSSTEMVSVPYRCLRLSWFIPLRVRPRCHCRSCRKSQFHYKVQA